MSPEQLLQSVGLQSDFVLHNCHFAVRIDGPGSLLQSMLAGFSEVRGACLQSGLRTAVEAGRVVPYTFPDTLQPRALTLVRGIARSRTLIQWMREQIAWNPMRPDYRKDIIVSALSVHRADVAIPEWELVFRNAFPTMWEAGDFRAMDNAILFEELTLQYECLDVERSIFEGLPGTIMDIIS
jgi:phage tail-like protein